jgi:hypothetical protein
VNGKKYRRPGTKCDGELIKRTAPKGLNMNNPGFQPGESGVRIPAPPFEIPALKKPPSDSPEGESKKRKINE